MGAPRCRRAGARGCGHRAGSPAVRARGVPGGVGGLAALGLPFVTGAGVGVSPRGSGAGEPGGRVGADRGRRDRVWGAGPRTPRCLGGRGWGRDGSRAAGAGCGSGARGGPGIRIEPTSGGRAGCGSGSAPRGAKGSGVGTEPTAGGGRRVWKQGSGGPGIGTEPNSGGGGGFGSGSARPAGLRGSGVRVERTAGGGGGSTLPKGLEGSVDRVRATGVGAGPRVP